MLWGFGHPAESLSLCPRKEKVTKEKACPDIRACPLRGQTSLAPVPLRRPAQTGHPWPDSAFRGIHAAHLLRNTCVRPSVRGSGTELPERCLGQPLVDKAAPLSTLRERDNRRVDGRSHPPITPKLRCPYSRGLRAPQTRSVCHCIPTRRVVTISSGNSYMVQATRCPSPLQEAERRCCAGGERQGCRERHSWARDGPSMPASGAAPERGKSGRKADRPGCWGALLLWLLSCWASNKKVTRPGGRNLKPTAHWATSPAPIAQPTE